jgi:Ca2+-transporting ATPase
LSIEETAARLHTSLEHGLESAQDANYRKSVHGANELAGEEKESIAQKFLQQFYENPLILLLMGSAGVSIFMRNTDDAISITLAILIVVTVGFVQEYRSEKSLEALNKLVPPAAHLTRGTHSSTVLASSLVPGDLVHFTVGDRIPADVRIIKAAELEIDESNLTGETNPVKKTTEAVQVPQYASVGVSERSCIAFMGTLVCSGNGSGIVVATGHSTEFGTVFEMMSEIAKPKTPLQTSMDKLGKELSFMSFGVIGLICLIGIVQGRGWLEMFQISVSLAVAAIPEGLPIIVTVTLALGCAANGQGKGYYAAFTLC